MKDEEGNLDKEACIKQKRVFIKKFNTISETHLKDDRIMVPLLKTIETLLNTDYLADDELQEDIMEIHRLAVAECNKSKNIVKLLAGVGCFAGMLNSSNPELC